MANYKIRKFAKSRIATIDICEIGKRKHHITGLIELDVTESRKRIREYNRNNKNKVSFNAWIIKVIAYTISKHESSASYLKGKNSLITFEDVNVSTIVEKDLDGQKVPIPLIIEKTSETSIEEITKQIKDAKNKKLTKKDIVLQKKANIIERLYYILPSFLRRCFWTYLLRHPKQAFKKMGNVAITSIGMIGRINGWFVPISIHPVCFGIGSIIKKPIVVKDLIEIREILNMSVLLDHDVIDGANMARFINDLSKNIENGFML